MKFSFLSGALPIAVCLRLALTLSMVNPLVNKNRVPGGACLPDAPVSHELMNMI